MAEEELQDQNPDEVTDQEQEQDSETELDIDALKAQAAKADEYKKYADRVKAENKTLEKQLKERGQASQNSQTNQSSQTEDDRFDRLELKTEGYKGEEIDFIMRNGGLSAAEDPLVKAAIDSLRKSERSLNATPSGTNKSPVYKKYTERDLKSMTAEQLEKLIPQE